MGRFTSCGSDAHLESNRDRFARKLPAYREAKHSGRRRETSAAQPQNMMCFYVSDSVENDVRRCIRSWEHRHAITVSGRTMTGEIKSFSGTVEGVARAPGAGGDLWLVTMRETRNRSPDAIHAPKLQDRATDHHAHSG
jgi:hypothetical protein